MTHTLDAAGLEAAKVSTDKLQEIIAGCEGVTPGPWVSSNDAIEYRPKQASPFEDQGASIFRRDHEDDAVIGGGAQDEQGGAVGVYRNIDAAHIARLDPATVRSMASELLSLRERITAYEAARSGEAVADPTYRSPKEDATYFGSILSLSTYQMGELEKAFQYHHDLGRKAREAGLTSQSVPSLADGTIYRPLADREKSATLAHPSPPNEAGAIALDGTALDVLKRFEMVLADWSKDENVPQYLREDLSRFVSWFPSIRAALPREDKAGPT